MTVTLNANYNVDITQGADEFAPLEEIIGQRNQQLRRLVRNHTHAWSYVNRRRFVDWSGGPAAPAPVTNSGGYLTGWSGLVSMSAGRTRLELVTRARNCLIQLALTTRAFAPFGATVTNTHGAAISIQTSILTGVTTADLVAFVLVQQNVNPGDIYAVRVRELNILQGNL